MNDQLSEPSHTARGARRSRSLAERLRLMVFGMLGFVGVLALLLASPSSPAQDARKIVYRLPIDGVIDLGLAPLVSRVLNEATEAGAAAVILDINTFGGRVDAAVLIRDALLHAEVPTVAFVNKRAISAGALIAIAAERIAMADGGTIGAATPVTTGALGAAPLPAAEKTVSYMRKEFGATAEARKRPPLLAEAMVDTDVEIKGVIDKGKLLTLTTDEALQHKLADFRANNIEAVLQTLGLSGAEVRHAKPTWAEALVRFLTNPVMSSLLMTIGILGVITEIRTPGFGVPGAIGLTSLGLFFWGHWLVQLAGFEELLLLGLGLLLLLVEVFVMPGFGILGILGLAALVGGLGLSLVGAGATWEVVLNAAWQVVLSLILALASALVLLRFLPRMPFGRHLVLEGGLSAREGYASAPVTDQGWFGKRGTALSTLRPAGIADLAGQRVDVVSDGAFIEAGEPIEVIHVDGNRIVVRRAQAGASQLTPSNKE
jgi:membrane-bound serine protease (ClpP class)